MRGITTTELARNLSQVLDNLTAKGEEIVVEQNHQQISRLVPSRTYLTALEAIVDLYRTLTERAGDDWLADSRAQPVDGETLASVGDPWST